VLIRHATTDLYGRAYSDAPDVPYSASLYTTQLALLLQYLRWDKSHIVGLSMGGAISIAFGSEHPHLVDGRIVVVAPAGMVQVRSTLYQHAHSPTSYRFSAQGGLYWKAASSKHHSSCGIDKPSSQSLVTVTVRRVYNSNIKFSYFLRVLSVLVALLAPRVNRSMR